jgi:hypothetical protein
MPETSNPHLFLYCLWRLEGGADYVAIEDLFEECWRVAPSRFGWSTKSHPSDKAGDQAMRDVLKSEETKDLLLLSGDRKSVRLSATGVAWVRERLDALDKLAQQRAPSQKRSQRHLVDLERSAIGQALLRGEELTAGRVEVADLLSLTPDADPAAFRQRLASYRSDAALAARGDALTILERLEATRPEWFNGKRSA